MPEAIDAPTPDGERQTLAPRSLITSLNGPVSHPAALLSRRTPRGVMGVSKRIRLDSIQLVAARLSERDLTVPVHTILAPSRVQWANFAPLRRI